MILPLLWLALILGGQRVADMAFDAKLRELTQLVERRQWQRRQIQIQQLMIAGLGAILERQRGA